MPKQAQNHCFCGQKFDHHQAYLTAHAARQDAGNRSMREAGRKKWNLKDFNAATEAFNKAYKPSEVIQ